MAIKIGKRAIQLQPGDKVIGPDLGVVKVTTVVDAGVQVTWEDGKTTTYAEDRDVLVERA